MAKSPAKPVTTKPTGKVLPDQTQGSATTEQPKAKAPAKKRDRSTLYANLTGVANTAVITLVPGAKAKQKGTLAEAKFALYGAGPITVADVVAKCQGEKRAKFTDKDGKVHDLKPSIRWDWAHGLIQIDGKAYEPKAA
jgi:hypothetical protein